MAKSRWMNQRQIIRIETNRFEMSIFFDIVLIYSSYPQWILIRLLCCVVFAIRLTLGTKYFRFLTFDFKSQQFVGFVFYVFFVSVFVILYFLFLGNVFSFVWRFYIWFQCTHINVSMNYYYYFYFLLSSVSSDVWLFANLDLHFGILFYFHWYRAFNLTIITMSSWILGFAIKCFECNSHYNQGCELQIVPSNFTVDCSLKRDVDEHQKPIQYTFCRKINQIIEFSVNQR